MSEINLSGRSFEANDALVVLDGRLAPVNVKCAGFWIDDPDLWNSHAKVILALYFGAAETVFRGEDCNADHRRLVQYACCQLVDWHKTGVRNSEPSGRNL